jgi:hypothetical protein
MSKLVSGPPSAASMATRSSGSPINLSTRPWAVAMEGKLVVGQPTVSNVAPSMVPALVLILKTEAGEIFQVVAEQLAFVERLHAGWSSALVPVAPRSSTATARAFRSAP